MTLVLSTLGQLMQTQFGVNEIASAIAIGKAVGSVFTRQKDAEILGPLGNLYGSRLRNIPRRLYGVSFDRSGTILGTNQRRIHCINTMEGVDLESVEGIATLVILVMRFVEKPRNIVDYIDRLMRGNYGIICGSQSGTSNISEDDVAKSSTTAQCRSERTPYAMHSLMLHFETGVIDADADSCQKAKCNQWMSELTMAVGDSKFLDESTRYSRSEHERFLSQLLEPDSDPNDISKKTFHTLSAGAAMAALAALANGASVGVECVKSDGNVKIPSNWGGEQDPVLVLKLWLVQPPLKIAIELKVLGNDEETINKTNGIEETLPIRGGPAEISWFISNQLNCNLTRDKANNLWNSAMAYGKRVSWNFSAYGKAQIVQSYSIGCELPSDLIAPAEGVDAWKAFAGDSLSLPSTLTQTRLEMGKIYHLVMERSEYSSTDDMMLQNQLRFVHLAYKVGCLQSLILPISDDTPRFSWNYHFDKHSWASGFLDNPGRREYSIVGLIFTIAHIWGGISSPPRGTFIVRNIIGLVCPETTILSSFLHRPQKMIREGFSNGIFSLHSGSIPLIPRRAGDNMILAGSPITKTRLGQFYKDRKANHVFESTQDFIFTSELYLDTNIGSSMVTCAWQHGDVVAEINPQHSFYNLIQAQNSGGNFSTMMKTFFPDVSIFPVSFSDILGSGQWKPPSGVLTVLDASDREDWWIIAAGIVESGKLESMSEEESRSFPNMTYRFGTLAITRYNLPREYKEKVNELKKLEATRANDQIIYTIQYDVEMNKFNVEERPVSLLYEMSPVKS
ncbi:hypothetical protein BS50DRAFT_621484 [Corynespora cassiicola Philippines]|uniref:Uncharacterized protein n=1 Tax=Corynespora cassiicola Philippines TaxID=1448308 RepID=A0A2T2NPY4_CORCC|nr:hypothetical protein BS50DRAFT_621484 [Corynespora cassiicola Philippines]